jgi:four helix bundle protein
MKYKDFDKLPVYKKARHLRKRIYELVKTLPSFEEYNLKLQMRKAATSVTNNIAEGNGRYYYQENLHFCRISRGSLNEILDDLTLCLDEDYADEGYLISIRQDALDVRQELNQYMAYLQRCQQTKHQEGG